MIGKRGVHIGFASSDVMIGSAIKPILGESRVDSWAGDGHPYSWSTASPSIFGPFSCSSRGR